MFKSNSNMKSNPRHHAYKLTVQTGVHKASAGTSYPVFVTLIGDKGTSPEIAVNELKSVVRYAPSEGNLDGSNSLPSSPRSPGFSGGKSGNALSDVPKSEKLSHGTRGRKSTDMLADTDFDRESVTNSVSSVAKEKDFFAAGSIREFIVETPFVGNVLKLYVQHVPPTDFAFDAAWRLEKVLVEDTTIFRSWCFVSHKWLNIDNNHFAKIDASNVVATGRRAVKIASKRWTMLEKACGSDDDGSQDGRSFLNCLSLFNSDPSAGFDYAKSSHLTNGSSAVDMGGVKRVRVRARNFSKENFNVYIYGSPDYLGSWNTNRGIRMHRIAAADGKFDGDWGIELLMDDTIGVFEYCYFVVDEIRRKGWWEGKREDVRVMSLIDQASAPSRTGEGVTLDVEDVILPVAVDEDVHRPTGQDSRTSSAFDSMEFHEDSANSQPQSDHLDNAKTAQPSSSHCQQTEIMNGSLSPVNPTKLKLADSEDGSIASYHTARQESITEGKVTSTRENSEAPLKFELGELRECLSNPRYRLQIIENLKTAFRETIAGGNMHEDLPASTPRRYSCFSRTNPYGDPVSCHDDELIANYRAGQKPVGGAFASRSVCADGRPRDGLEKFTRCIFVDENRELCGNAETDHQSVCCQERATADTEPFAKESEENMDTFAKHVSDVHGAGWEYYRSPTVQRNTSSETRTSPISSDAPSDGAGDLTDEEHFSIHGSSQYANDRDAVHVRLTELEKSLRKLKNQNGSYKNGLRQALHQYNEFREEFEGLRSRMFEMCEDYESKNIELGRLLLDSEDSRHAEAQLLRQERDDALVRWSCESKRRKECFNLLQELRGNIRVYCRVRPLKDPSALATGDTLPLSFPDSDLATEAVSSAVEIHAKRFEFDNVFGPVASQTRIYDEISEVVTSVLDGYNVCIFAYGQTGSGKTHTMDGTARDPGVNPRALIDLFQLARTRRDHSDFEFSASMLEIYNESLYDLIPELKESSSESASNTSAAPKLDILKNPFSSSRNAVIVPHLTKVRLENDDDALRVLQVGTRNRAQQATSMNQRSSRSHLIMSVTVKATNRVTSECTQASLSLVDLAGSERVGRSNVSGARLREAQHINKSLAALGDVFKALLEKADHVPYRNSKLTHFLQESLGGQSKTLMFVNVSCDRDDSLETVSSLQFAQCVAKVELGAATKNSDTTSSAKVSELKSSLAAKDSQITALRVTIVSHERELRKREQRNEELQRKALRLEDNLNSAAKQLEQSRKREERKDSIVATAVPSQLELKKLQSSENKLKEELRIARMKHRDAITAKDEEIKRLNLELQERDVKLRRLKADLRSNSGRGPTASKSAQRNPRNANSSLRRVNNGQALSIQPLQHVGFEFGGTSPGNDMQSRPKDFNLKNRPLQVQDSSIQMKEGVDARRFVDDCKERLDHLKSEASPCTTVDMSSCGTESVGMAEHSMNDLEGIPLTGPETSASMRASQQHTLPRRHSLVPRPSTLGSSRHRSDIAGGSTFSNFSSKKPVSTFGSKMEARDDSSISSKSMQQQPSSNLRPAQRVALPAARARKITSQSTSQAVPRAGFRRFGAPAAQPRPQQQ